MKFVFEERIRTGRWRRRFEAPIICVPCTVCGTPVTIGAPFCPFHLDDEYGLAIREEARIGRGQLGLFATRKFTPGEFMIPYGGELIDNKELQRRYGDGTAPYALELNRKLCHDAALVRSPGAHANHFEGLETEPNARFEKLNGVMWLQCISPISKGEAVLVDYGSEYELFESDFRYRTQR